MSKGSIDTSAIYEIVFHLHRSRLSRAGSLSVETPKRTPCTPRNLETMTLADSYVFRSCTCNRPRILRDIQWVKRERGLSRCDAKASSSIDLVILIPPVTSHPKRIPVIFWPISCRGAGTEIYGQNRRVDQRRRTR